MGVVNNWAEFQEAEWEDVASDAVGVAASYNVYAVPVQRLLACSVSCRKITKKRRYRQQQLLY